MSKQNSRGTGLSPAFKRREAKPYWRKEWLKREYVEKRRSALDIASECGGGETNVLYFLAKHSIPRRSMAETRKIKKWGLFGKANGMFGQCGAQNPRWIDGSSPERQRLYARSFWKELVRTVYARDGYKCLRCNAIHGASNRLHAHHVKRWAGNKETRFDLSNIVTLCNTCHNWVHSKKNTQREYLSS